jgi:hypothetical protein
MADSSIGPACAQTNTVTLLNLSDRLCTVRHLVVAVEMMASDIEDVNQRSAFARVFEVLRERIYSVETDLDAIRAGEAA